MTIDNDQRDECIFCKIVSKTVPSKIVYEDDNILAFLDIDPISEGHTLVIPKKHYDNIFVIDNNILSEISRVSKLISEKILNVLESEGINIIQNNREAAGQIVSHYHMHVIPRWKNDGFKALYAEAPPQKDLFSMLDETLSKIKI